MIFKSRGNFTLIEGKWSETKDSDLVKVLDSALTLFYAPLISKSIPTKTVEVNHIDEDPHPNKKADPDPVIYRSSTGDKIYLTASERKWDQLAYQFSHELCHHVFNTLDNNNDPYGWLEESFCELASIVVMRNMAKRWKFNYPFTHAGGYHSRLTIYIDGVTNDESCQIDTVFSTWVRDNLQNFKGDRYNRTHNKIRY